MDVLRSSSAQSVSEHNGRTLGDLLISAALDQSGSGIRVVPPRSIEEAAFVSYPDLLQEARRILAGLRQRIDNPDRKVVILIERPREFIATFWACIMGGYVPCPMIAIRSDPVRWENHLSHVDRLLDRPLFIGAGGSQTEWTGSVEFAELDELRRDIPDEHVSRVGPLAPAILMLTSGSTGQAKAVELTHGNLLASLEGRAKRQQLTHADVTFNWIAFDHVAALLESHMIALYVGATQLHAEPASILTEPLNFLRLIDRYRVTVAFAPNFLLGQINAAMEEGGLGRAERCMPAFDLSCLRRIVTGGEANVVETGQRFLKLLAPYGLRSGAVWPAFGMTETCAASVYSDEFPRVDVGHEFAAVGRPIEGLSIRIVNGEGRVCGPGEAGDLQVRGPIVFRRYFNNEEATNAAFTTDGWFRTGDVGRIENERLRLVARSKDSIIVSGVNYYSQELETKLEQLEGIERAYVAAFPIRPKGADTEQLVVSFATTLDPADEDGLYQLVLAVRNTTIMLWGFRPAMILPLPKLAFPKTSLGKIQRSLMRARLEAGDFESDAGHIVDLMSRMSGPHVPPIGQLENTITQVFAGILKVEPSSVSTTMSYFDLGGTSLDILRLARALQPFGLDATIPIVLQNPTVRQIAARIANGGASEPGSPYDPIVPLQLTGKKTPLFCVHPGNGEVFVLVNVAKYFINDRPFYALRPRGFNKGEEFFRSVSEMVNTYVDAILRTQPQGPYAIAGYSLGGQIAFEIAKELVRRGNEVRFLCCIDGRPLHEPSVLNFNMATGLALVIDLITRAQFEELNRELRPEMPTDEVCEHVLSVASPRRLAELDLDIQKFSIWSRVAQSIEAMLLANSKSGTVDEMTILCSEGMSSRYTGVETTRRAWRQELQNWERFVLRPKFVDIPGHHHTLMGPRHVAAFQAILRGEIDRALIE